MSSEALGQNYLPDSHSLAFLDPLSQSRQDNFRVPKSGETLRTDKKYREKCIKLHVTDRTGVIQ